MCVSALETLTVFAAVQGQNSTAALRVCTRFRGKLREGEDMIIK